MGPGGQRSTDPASNTTGPTVHCSKENNFIIDRIVSMYFKSPFSYYCGRRIFQVSKRATEFIFQKILDMYLLEEGGFFWRMTWNKFVGSATFLVGVLCRGIP